MMSSMRFKDGWLREQMQEVCADARFTPVPIMAVYEKYKHLDHLLTDTEWLPQSPQGEILCDFWQAIKKSVEGDG